MIVCPKCGQPSTSDKICSNCWSDMNAKPKPPKPADDGTFTKGRNIVLLGLLLIVVFYLLSLMMDSMKGNISPAQPAVTIPLQTTPVPMVSPTAVVSPTDAASPVPEASATPGLSPTP